MSKKKQLTDFAEIYRKESLEGAIVTLKMSEIRPAEEQPRQDKDIGVRELASSLEQDGQFSPLLVRRQGNGYIIIAGERRYRAAKLLGWDQIECKVINKDAREAYRLGIIENIQRENLSAFEEASAMRTMKRMGDITDKELAETFGKSRSYMTEILSIAQLPDDILEEARECDLSSKNMLIQLTQAHKRERAKDFIRNFREGRIKTVRDAKDFNAGKDMAWPEPTPTNTNPPEKPKSKPKPGTNPQSSDTKSAPLSRLSAPKITINKSKKTISLEFQPGDLGNKPALQNAMLEKIAADIRKLFA